MSLLEKTPGNGGGWLLSDLCSILATQGVSCKDKTTKEYLFTEILL